MTFLPLAVPGSGVFSAASALLVVGITSTASRWWAGRFGDRRDPRLLLAPGLLACAAGMVCLPLGGVVLLVGAVLFGTGFGLLQNATLILMMGRVSKSEYGLGSTLWNAAFDAGTGIGAFSFGFVISAVGFSWSFFICSALVASALLLVILDYSRQQYNRLPPINPRSTIQSAITIYRDILQNHSRPSGRRRRDVRSGHDGLRGWEADDGALLEALSREVHDGVGDRRVVSALRGRSRLPFLPASFPIIWAVPFFLAPAFVAVARGLAGLTEARTRKGGAVDRGEQGAGASGGARAAWGALARAGGAGDFAHRRRGEPDALGSCQQRSRGGKGARGKVGVRALGARQA